MGRMRSHALVLFAFAGLSCDDCEVWTPPPTAMATGDVAAAGSGGSAAPSAGSAGSGAAGRSGRPATGSAGTGARVPATPDAGAQPPAAGSDDDAGTVGGADAAVPNPAEPDGEPVPPPPGGGMLNPGDLQCPNEVCAALPAPPAGASGMFSVELCCAASGDCGTSLNAAECVATPDNHPGCPLIMLMSFMIPSCCTPEGQCGIDGSAFMRGCTSLEAATTMAMGFIELPAPAACTPLAASSL